VTTEPTTDLHDRYAEAATEWALMYPLANWPWLGPRGSGDADAMSLDGMARNIAAAWGRDIADRMLAVRDEELERLRTELAARVEQAEGVVARVRELRDQWALASASIHESLAELARIETYAAVVANLDIAIEGNGAELLARLRAAQEEANDSAEAEASETVRAEEAEAAIERVRALRGRSSMGRVNDYVTIAEVRAALDGGHV
jgi:hypothetical protein